MKTSLEHIEIIDQDLLERVAKAVPLTKARVLDLARQEQAERNEERARLAAMTPNQLRRDEARKLVESADISKERHFIHSVLALCALPYRRPEKDEREHVRKFGSSTLIVQAGSTVDPVTGTVISQGLPYGPKARLWMVQLCTMALRNNSPEIEIEQSLSQFMRELGLEPTGGAKGSITSFKEQLQRLAASRFQFMLKDMNTGRIRTINTQPIESFDLWVSSKTTDQRSLFPDKVTLDTRFFETLKRHALPVDLRILQAFSQSARQMDIIMWLGYRLQSLERPLTIGWGKLQEQFGGVDATRERRFRQHFKDDWARVCEVFDKLPGRLDEAGLTIAPVDPSVLLLPRRKKRSAA